MSQMEPTNQPEPAVAKETETLSFPAALAQEIFCFLDQLEPNNPAFNVSVRFELKGAVDTAILEQSFNEMIARHEALRTYFDEENGEMVQVIVPAHAIKVDVTDLTSLPVETRGAEADRLASVEALKPLDLRRLPLLRVGLVRLTTESSILLVTVHHAVADGWSVGIITDELAALYEARVQGVPCPLPALPIQFADFTMWQREYLAGPEIAAQLAYWKKRLAGMVEPNLPTDRPRPLVKRWEGDIAGIMLPKDLTDRLQQISQQNGATLFMTFLAAFKVLLVRYTNQEDIAIGSPIVGRTRAEVEKLIGVFINTVILRTNLSGNPSFIQALGAVRDTAIEAVANQDLPFETLVKELQPERSSGRMPLFQINFTHQRDFVKPVKFAGIKLTAMPSRPVGAIFDLHFFMVERNGIWRASCDYSTELFNRDTALRMLAHFQCLLESIASKPATPIGELNMLTAEERQTLTIKWNQTQREYPQEKTLHGLFEEQARNNPAKLALHCEDKAITYAELNQRADQLAVVLRSLGVGPDVPVGLCTYRTSDLMVGLLGILKAGGAYVPIDPAYPADRIAFVLEDSRAPVLVTQSVLVATLPATNAQRILLDEPLPVVNSSSAVTPASVGPGNLAYILYTSGSSGKPKGVQIEHRAVVNFLNSMRREPGLTAQDVLLAVTTLSFDIAGLELHLPLTTGASIILAPWDVAADGAALLREIERHRVTLLQATPATWRLMIAAGWKGTPQLKALCGGEALPSDLASELIPRCGELWNMYGPTETTIWSTCSRVTNAKDIHIGRPIDNTEIYILDAHQQPLPVGLAGELLIGGDGLARGYHHRPELSADRFVAHPFKPGARLYRTGDLARYRPDGNIDCLGRLDFQVKIRGFRIELGEIESELAAHPAISQAVVAAREDQGDKRLVAYLVSRTKPEPEPSELRDHLRGKLPEYMVPATFVYLPALPLTPNGKVDRKALPAPGVSVIAATQEAVPPRNETEKRLAVIFERVLGNPIRSVRESFFDLGGHSLLAVKLMNLIEREFDMRLPLARLFMAPSIEQLATVLTDKAPGEMQWKSLMPIQPRKDKATLFLIHGAGGNVLLYREVVKGLGEDVSVYGFQSQGLDHKTPPFTNIEAMAEHYVRELKALQPTGPYNLAGYCMGGAIAYEMARLIRNEGGKMGLVALLDTYNLSEVKQARQESSRFSVLSQKVGFHLDNLTQLKAKDLFGYLGEKLRMAEESGKGKIAASLKSLKNAVSGAAEETGAEVHIQDINHHAAWEFVPQPLDVGITAFSPRKNYDFFPDPKMGWSDLVKGELEIVELPVNPHAMLIEPCASLLAQELKKRLVRGASDPSELRPNISAQFFPDSPAN